jgi:predicted small metal-binding protein
VKKRVDCECGWFLETASEDELVEGVQRHGQEVHQMTGITREQVLAQAKPV